ncbi:hypothetical protein ACWD6L_15000 [Micromonospora profundi]|uniref:Uncharacterized protein n=1 Tax=Micromonospora profundi TaxID=1420889 RepID=A0AAJ6HS23_9ACTN|nr:MULTISPECIES: hypothetical protein [Micromonospora]NJC13628.1 hypothetical protein [Micromonospora profundi]WLS45212.1 hypothetical protein Q3V37_28265 [Micromonospora profundi]
MGILRVRAKHQPFEVAALITTSICGVLLMTLDARPPSVQLSMPEPIQLGWEVSLIVVGVAGLLGILWPGRLSTGLGIEFASVLVLGTITGMYAVALVAVSGQQGVVAASLISAVPAGSFWRAAQIANDLRCLAYGHQCTTHRRVVGGVT